MRRKCRGGYGRHPLYFTWKNMVRRCTDPRHKSYRIYRHVEIYPDWIDSPENFLKYLESTIGPRPTKKHSIDRIDNTSGYVPGNLRWATPLMQRHNQRNLRRFLWEGEWLSVRELSAISGVPQNALKQRLTTHKWPIYKAMTTPLVPRSVRHLYGQDRIPIEEELPNH